MWNYRATVLRWVDGDTVDLSVDLGFYTEIKLMRFRLMAASGGIDTPEKNSPDDDLRARALKATARCNELAPAGSPVTITTAKGDPRDSFGRFLAIVRTPAGADIGEALLAERLATRWPRPA
jgi:micrococcal nuclease